MWSKEEYKEFFSKLFGFEFSDTELDNLKAFLDQSRITNVSRHGGNTVAFTPLMLQNLINEALKRTGATVQDKKFKKISEEVLPAIFFTLQLKKLGYGEHLIVSGDVPDIVLVDFDRATAGQPQRRVGAIPVEAICITDNAMNEAAGGNATEKFANAIIAKKFGKAYLPQTILLISINSAGHQIDMAELSRLLLREKVNPFHGVWVFGGMGQNECTISQLTPSYQPHKVNVEQDLKPLMY